MIGLIMGLRSPYNDILYIVCTYEEYKKCRIPIETILNEVQVKPDSCNYTDKNLPTGTIKATKVEFGINAKENIELIQKVKFSDRRELLGQEKDENQNLFYRLLKTKRELDIQQLEQRNKLKNSATNYSKVQIILHETSFEIQKGEIICLTGRENSGKSMFLYSLLGECTMTQGDMKMNGSLGYFNGTVNSFVSGTVRDNIVMSKRFNAEKYERAVNISRLDFSNMVGEDFMQVTDGGNNLEHKEQLKIMFARLLYLDPDIYLIDDFFDHLRPQLRHMFFKNLKEYCKQANKTLIFVSSRELLAKRADKVFYFEDCQLVEIGKQADLLAKLDSKYFIYNAGLNQARAQRLYKYKELLEKKRKRYPKPQKFERINQSEDCNCWFGDTPQTQSNTNQLHKESEAKDSTRIIDGKLGQNSKAEDVIALKLKKFGQKRLKQKIDSSDTQELKQINIQNAIINLMRVCVKRQEGKIIKKDTEIVIKSQMKAVLKYLTTGGKGRLALQIIMSFLAALLGFTLDFWLLVIKRFKWIDFGDSYMIPISIWMGLNILVSFFSLIKDFVLRSTLCKNSDAIYRGSIMKLVYDTNMEWFKHHSSTKLNYLLTEDITNVDDSLNELFTKLMEIGFSLFLIFVKK